MKLANFSRSTTTSIAGTLGNGAVTLSAITSVPTLMMGLGLASGSRTVRYTIEQVSTKKIETGLGILTSAGVLTRSKVQVTWDGTTYRDGGAGGAAVALQFGSTPTVEDVIVRLGPTAEQPSMALPSRSNVSISDSWRDFPWSSHIAGNNNGGAGTLNTGVQAYSAFHQEHAGLLTGFQLEVMGTPTTTNLKVGLYEIGVDGMPGNMILQFNTMNVSTTGIKTDTATGTWTPGNAVWLTPGWYAFGYMVDANATFRCGYGNMVIQHQSPFGRINAYGQGYHFYITRAYASGLQSAYDGTAGTWPSNGGSTNLHQVFFGLRVVP